MHSLWLNFLSFLSTSCYKFRDRFLGVIYKGYHLCFLFDVLGCGRLLTEINPLNNNNNSILLL